jgi:hypothetical protein
VVESDEEEWSVIFAFSGHRTVSEWAKFEASR